MPRILPHEIKSMETQKSILDAAERMLAEGDFRAVTVRNICQESGAAYGSFYHHFGTKENVIAACCERLWAENLRENPLPAVIDRRDYVSQCLWFGLVFGQFCAMLGKELIRFLYLNSDRGDQLFSSLFEEGFFPCVEAASRTDMMKTQIHSPDDAALIVGLIKKDLRITCVGTLLWWCCLPESGTKEPLCETLEHHLFHQLIHTASDAFHQADFPHTLLTPRGIGQTVRVLPFRPAEASARA